MRTKEMRGITLIALVITIVIIMILAGVTINLVVGNNNLFDKAKSTQKIQTVAGIKEALELEKVDIQVESKKVDLDTYLEQISTGKKNYNLSSKEKVDEKNAEIIVNDEYKFLVKDKENGDVEIIYDGIAKADDLTISSKNGTYTYPNSGTFEVTNNTSRGELTVSSDASNIATASIEGNTITVKPETVAGKANIIVRSSANGEYAENKVIHVATVKNGTIELEAIPYDGVYDGQAHNAFTSISTNPSDVKLEYSLDGNEYNEEMPTITNTSEFTVTVKASKEGYKTQITTETVKVSKAEGKLKLSATSGTITYPSNATFTVSGNTGTLSVSSNNNNIATASVSGNTVTVKSGTTVGKATITVTSAEASNYTAKSATYTATVNNGTISLSATPYNGTYDGKAHNALTNVSANPSDAKIEYSINGGTYSTTMPTITNVSSFTVTVRASKAGYTTKVITETTKINKASGTLKLSATSGTSTNFNNVTFSVSGNTGSLSVSSSNSKFATASIRGNTVTVKPIMAGSATITVTSAATANYTAASATYKITINGAPFTASSGVGYYTDVNSDGVADGVIFVDLKNGASGTWEGQSYNYAAVSGTKSYKIVQKNYNGPFGTKDVLQPSGSGNKRFHVMALKDVDSNKYDFWGAQSKSGNGWTVPPWSAWAAFAAKMGLSMSGSGNYGQFKMSYIYWSSESFKGMFFDQNTYGCYVRFDGNGRAAFGDGVAESNWCYVRLQTTF
jgi:competence protein ComGC